MNDELKILTPDDSIKKVWDLHFSAREYWQSWYIDIVCPGWKVLATKNDEIPILPLCSNRLGFWTKRLQQPHWMQSLPFNCDINRENVSQWIKHNFNSYQIQFAVDIQLNNLSKAKNSILELSQSEEILLKGMSENRRRNIKKFEKCDYPILEVNSTDALVQVFFTKQNHSNWRPSKKQLTMLFKIVSTGIENKKVSVLQTNDHEGNYLASAIFLLGTKRITYLMGSSSAKGRSENAMTGLFWNIIRRNSATPMVFDFEGGNLSGTGRFYKEFGAIEEPYYVYRKKLFGLV